MKETITGRGREAASRLPRAQAGYRSPTRSRQYHKPDAKQTAPPLQPSVAEGFCKVDQDRFGLTKQRGGRHLSNPSNKLLVVGPQSVDARDKQEGHLSFRPEGAAHTSPGCNPGYPWNPNQAFCQGTAGTPQRVGLGRRPRFTNRRRSFRTPGDTVDGTQGVALGWYAVSRWDTRSRSPSPDHSHSSNHLVRSLQHPMTLNDLHRPLGINRQAPRKRLEAASTLENFEARFARLFLSFSHRQGPRVKG